MCMAAIYGGISFEKGLGVGHAITHVLGGHYHISHGKAATIGLLCFVKANKEACKEKFIDLAWALDRTEDLEKALVEFYKNLNISERLKDIGVPEKELRKIAFYAYRDVVNIATNPSSISEHALLELLKNVYE